ncbi:putative 3-dehydroquinate dehydratase, Shikimate dehydrogenase [Helianthus annuus]|uniref:3-dehydroquinate dehydratase, Shikimate dehydrogenase n=1 Tax=Helianthus annuus TaxID=4232 RepID=A0A251SU60_HELAN|nr:putative 3-dehydroquinate dehydratase, Shikimate dehydrogenase [Helianthus annuus]KAJ0477536.1 putative 3-dehydroquinate dehydratase, Shikimate dehydrogenase (NADP(+)) [Helianthus annuus]KAJ0482027.1 putative 3-dehydroquinate dehydratase, Shikimate dehydrogenase [Helianthus annuus]KAJ0498368.1 putative 3-dehydroquinate dehydratase, Shikimate dehydrogenase (NADP(+)) [Helianthus annuus]KAJ0664378.1 putative 3-dehydroquinate dehydratase, Shikimate dehydrogenase (NADP(+)) [Helianthus annuus]
MENMAETEGLRTKSTLICAPIMADTVDQMLLHMNSAKSSGADLVEIRFDSLKGSGTHEDIKTLIESCPLPTLFTYRPTWEGGQYDGDEQSRLAALKLAMELGADHIDVELQAVDEFKNLTRGDKPTKCKLIVSSHNYQNTPSLEDLESLVARIQSTGADIVKIATMAVDITDVARIFHVTAHSQVPIISMAMGERGLISRLLSPKFGGYLTFATLGRGKESAPGQPTIRDLLDVFNFRQIAPDTKVYGIIGKPVGHSKSPMLYNKAFRSIGFNGVYVHLLVDNVKNFLETYSSTDYAGFSCTIPHKEAVVECCDEVDPVAKSIGAVNCVIRRQDDGKLYGCNTDYVGAITAIEDGLRASGVQDGSNGSPLAGRLFVVIGAGGAGKALAYGAKAKGARIVIANRTYERARELAEIIGGKALSLADLSTYNPEDGMILANTTSIGMQPNFDETPVSKEALKSYALVFDAVYTPKITRLLREAGECGALIVTGVEMFIGQAYEQYEKFTGLPGKHLRSYLGRLWQSIDCVGYSWKMGQHGCSSFQDPSYLMLYTETEGFKAAREHGGGNTNSCLCIICIFGFLMVKIDYCHMIFFCKIVLGIK